MVANRHSVGIAVVTLFLVAAVVVGYAALIGFESSFLPECMIYFQRTAPVTAASTARLPSSELSSQRGSNTTVPAMDVNENSTNATISSKGSKSTPAAPVNVDAEGQQANVIKSQDSSSTTVAYDPKLIRKIERQKNNCLSPPHVHLIWIGDINKAPIERIEYIEKGYTLTVHTDPEEILDGFHPFVLKAYYQAVPKVVGYDFLKFALLYKYGGFVVDADTSPAILASEIQWPSDCELIFGKEANAKTWEKPVFRKHGGPEYGLIRPFQILNWAMAASKPRNPHIKWLLKTAMMHFLGLRDMESTLIQDISGSGLMTDYVALLHEEEGRDYRNVYEDRTKYIPVEGLCLTDGHMHGAWIRHSFLASWKKAGHYNIADLIFPYKPIEHDA